MRRALAFIALASSVSIASLFAAGSQDPERGPDRVGSTAADSTEGVGLARAFSATILANPEPRPGARFGAAVVALDFDGDGRRDFGIGAPGEGAAYVLLATGKHQRFAADYGRAERRAERRREGPSGEPAQEGEDGQARARMERRTEGPVARSASGRFGGRGDGDVDGAEVVAGQIESGRDAEARARAQAGARGDAGREAPQRVRPAKDRFGTSIASADLDGDGDDELIVGAPGAPSGGGTPTSGGAVYVFGLKAGRQPVALRSESGREDAFGQAVACADFDGDGTQDLVVGSFKGWREDVSCGRVDLYYDWFGESPRRVEFPNPLPTAAGSFGAHVAVTDHDGDGKPDLFVSGVGNDTTDGRPHGGQVYYYPGPPKPDTWIVVEDSIGKENDPPRFGMHIFARDGFLAVGSPRKDTPPLDDTGLGQSFSGVKLDQARLHRHPSARADDLFGYRTLIGDFYGDDELDIAFSCLPSQQGPDRNPLAMYIYDGSGAGEAPLELLALRDSGDHFTVGVTVVDVDGNGRDDPVLGDPTWDRPGEGRRDDVGRVVIYH